MFHANGPPCILGRYRLLGRTLGKGNYARVEEACHLDLDAPVAIKMIDTHTVQDTYVLRNLHREADVLRRLKHPNIVAIFEQLRAGSFFCIVTELVGGGELSTYVSRQPRGHLDEATTLLFGAQLISALAHMHSINVVHRDLKLRNIMLTKRNDMVKIVDFGLGRTWSPSRPLTTHCGSPGYAAPEIYQRGRPYGPEVDLWSLGVVLYYMAVGRMPFAQCRDRERSAEERRKRLEFLISKGATEHHVKLMGHFSPEFRDLIQGLLTPNVARRLSLRQTTEHPWVSNRLRARQMLNIQYKLSSQERALILTKLALIMKTTVQSFEATCRQNLLGEFASMYHIMAHKQLSTYHASWALRTASPRRLAADVVVASGVRVSSPHHRPGTPSASTALRRKSETTAEGRVDQPQSSGEEEEEAVKANSGTWVTSLSTERSMVDLCAPQEPLERTQKDTPQGLPERTQKDTPQGLPERTQKDTPQGLPERTQKDTPQGLPERTQKDTPQATLRGQQQHNSGRVQRALPPPPQTRLAVLEHGHHVDDKGMGVRIEHGRKEEVVQDGGVTKDVTGETDKPREGAPPPSETPLEAPPYDVACLLTDADGKERLEPLPATRVMFYTETILDNVYEALTRTGLKESIVVPMSCPVKSALASQVGPPVAKTRKAVSFSGIATNHAFDKEHRRETGIQVNLICGADREHSEDNTAEEFTDDAERTPVLQPLPKMSEVSGEDSSQVEQSVPPAGASCLNLVPSASGGNQQNGGASKRDIAMTEKFLKTVPISRKMSPEPRKGWPLRSARKTFRQMKGHSGLSLSYLLSNQDTLINAITRGGENSSTVPPATQSTTLKTHQQDKTKDEYSTNYPSCRQIFIETQGVDVSDENKIQSVAVTNNVVSAQEEKKSARSSEKKSGSLIDRGDLMKHSTQRMGTALKLDAKYSKESSEIKSRLNKTSKEPLNTVSDLEKTKARVVKIKAKQLDTRQKYEPHDKPQTKHRRCKVPHFQKVFPNRYRVDLALVMTLERSRRNMIPSIHSPWKPSKQDNLFKP